MYVRGFFRSMACGTTRKFVVFRGARRENATVEALVRGIPQPRDSLVIRTRRGVFTRLVQGNEVGKLVGYFVQSVWS